jgi:hypothetical protein
MSTPSHSPWSPDDTTVDNESSKKSRFYENMRTADKRLTELLANGHAFSKWGDDLLPIWEPQIVITPFIQES